MSIVFEPFSPPKTTYYATLDRVLPILHLRNRDLDAELPLLQSEFLADVQIGPQLVGIIAALPLLQGEIKAGYRQMATLDTDILLFRGFLTEDTTFLIGELPTLRGHLSARDPITVAITLPGLRATMVLEFDADNYISEIVATDEITADLIMLLSSMAAFGANLSYVNNLRMTLESSVVAQAAFTYVFQYEHQDSIVATDNIETLFSIILALADELVMSDEMLSHTDALLTIVSALVLSDMVKLGQDLTFESAATWTDTLESQLRMVASLLSEFLAEDEMITGASFVATLDSDMVLTDEPTWTLAAMFELLDQVDFSVRLRLPGHDGGLYVGYAMNIRNGGTTEYDNYPFVDYAEVGGVVLAAGPDGIYRIDGDDDDGDPITALVRTGLYDFGTAMLKHVPNAYVGYTTTGVLVLKTITEKDGKRQENWYKLAPRETTMAAENRFSIAKGLASMYWGFEVSNLDGADFELDAIRVWPLVIQRRQSGR